MPLEGLAEALIRPVVELVLQPVAEAAIHLIGYLTGLVVVPVATLGRVVVEQHEEGVEAMTAKWVQAPSGRIVINANLGSMVGFLTWLLIGGAALMIYFMSGPS
ncbi:hypothetical protein QMO14_09310 [Variovorax sp. CAN2819]|uniref:hypothetical protein n=1 Tax=Variovorax sp. CAN15 TaxID=3046727 RepID=UPI002649093B|nr:hypothetical protein [Variovorax sp. CAN15]MDN6883793.1 hypothetical protein [Variovorax sp. CAN15]